MTRADQILILEDLGDGLHDRGVNYQLWGRYSHEGPFISTHDEKIFWVEEGRIVYGSRTNLEIGGTVPLADPGYREEVLTFCTNGGK